MFNFLQIVFKILIKINRKLTINIIEGVRNKFHR